MVQAARCSRAPVGEARGSVGWRCRGSTRGTVGAVLGLCSAVGLLPHVQRLGSSPCRAPGSAGAGAQAPPALCPCPNTGLLGLLGPHPASILTTPAPGKEPTAAPCLRQKVVHSPWAALGWPRPQSAPHISAHLPSHPLSCLDWGPAALLILKAPLSRTTEALGLVWCWLLWRCKLQEPLLWLQCLGLAAGWS